MNAGTIIVADDHPLFRDALRGAIEGLVDNYKVRTAGSFEEVIVAIESADDAEMVLLDLKMPGNNGFAGLLRLRKEHPDLPVLVVSASEDAVTIGRTLEAGASGFIPKSTDPEQIGTAINAVLAGGIWLPPDYEPESADDGEFAAIAQRLQSLTPQQNRVLSMLGEGLLNKQIAYELGVSEATVKAHVSAVLTKLGVDSRTQAVIMLGRLGMTRTGDGQAVPQT